jgi:hypothetical protein
MERLFSYMTDRYYVRVLTIMSLKFTTQNNASLIGESSHSQRPEMYILIFIIIPYLPLTLREEHRLKVFENTVLRRIFGPKRNEMIGGWRKLHNEVLNTSYSSRNIRIIKRRKMRWAGHVARMGR